MATEFLLNSQGRYDHPLLAAYSQLWVRIQLNVNQALAVDTAKPGDGAIGRAAHIWKQQVLREQELEKVEKLLVALAGRIDEVASNDRLSDVGRAEQVKAITDRTRRDIETAKNRVLAASEEILDTLRSAWVPKRPGVPDATQEAALMNIKADLRMSLDPIKEPGPLVTRMAELFERAVANRDELSVWLLAATDWPVDYLTARGMELASHEWTPRSEQILERLGSADRSDLNQAYRAVNSPQDGLPALPTVFNLVSDFVANPPRRPFVSRR